MLVCAVVVVVSRVVLTLMSLNRSRLILKVQVGENQRERLTLNSIQFNSTFNSFLSARSPHKTMNVQLHLDPSATTDIHLSQLALPPSAQPGNLVAIRPLETGRGKRKDRPLLYKVPPRVTDDDESDPTKGRRGGAQVIVTPNVALSFPWAKRRTLVVLELVSYLDYTHDQHRLTATSCRS